MPSARKRTTFSRRGFLSGAAAACGGAVLSTGPRPAAAAEMPDVPPEDYRIQNGRIRQSVMGWCFKPMPMDELIEACHRMGMPAMDGAETYPVLREARPGMKVILCSGLEPDEASRAVLEAGVFAFLRKPFTADELTLAVQESLDA